MTAGPHRHLPEITQDDEKNHQSEGHKSKTELQKQAHELLKQELQAKSDLLANNNSNPGKTTQSTDLSAWLKQQAQNSLNQAELTAGRAWNEAISDVTGYKPEQIANNIKPEAAYSIDHGRKLETDINAGSRTNGSLTAQEQHDLNNYHQFQKTISTQTPGFEHKAFQASIEEAIAARAKEHELGTPGHAGNNHQNHIKETKDVSINKSDNVTPGSKHNLSQHKVSTNHSTDGTIDRAEKAQAKANNEVVRPTDHVAPGQKPGNSFNQHISHKQSEQGVTKPKETAHERQKEQEATTHKSQPITNEATFSNKKDSIILPSPNNEQIPRPTASFIVKEPERLRTIIANMQGNNPQITDHKFDQKLDGEKVYEALVNAKSPFKSAQQESSITITNTFVALLKQANTDSSNSNKTLSEIVRSLAELKSNLNNIANNNNLKLQTPAPNNKSPEVAALNKVFKTAASLSELNKKIDLPATNTIANTGLIQKIIGRTLSSSDNKLNLNSKVGPKINSKLDATKSSDTGKSNTGQSKLDGKIKLTDAEIVKLLGSNAKRDGIFICSRVDRRHIFGAEVAIAALIAAAGVARNRPDIAAKNNEPNKKPDEITQNNQNLLDFEPSSTSDKKSLEQEHTTDHFEDALLKQSTETTNTQKTVLHRPFIFISPKDTLVSIAEMYFHDPGLAWLIADLNKQNIKETHMDGKRIVEIKSRQRIELPVWEDIVEFYGNRPTEAKPENIITIIYETQIDREVLDTTLGAALGLGSQSKDSPKDEENC